MPIMRRRRERRAMPLLVRGGEKPETWGTKGGCLKCQAPRCIHCAQVDAKWVKNPDYDRIMAERKKRAKEAENAGPAGREMTYKEKKAAEKKKEGQGGGECRARGQRNDVQRKK